MNAMEGANLRAERMIERELLVAHHNAAWTGAAYAGKLKPFASYKKKDPTASQQTPQQMLGMLHYFREMGAEMDIKKVN